MTDQHFDSGSPNPSLGGNSRPGDRPEGAKEAFSKASAKASDMARDAGEKVKRAASDTASTVTDTVKEMLDRQLGAGATMAGQFAGSIRLAADDLDREAPMLGGFVRGFANTVDGYAESLEGQTVEQLARSASDFTRRQPALVLGLAAVAGFFMFRTWKSAQPVASPPIQPMQTTSPADRDHG